MSTAQQPQPIRVPIMGLAVALFVALTYMLIALNILAVGNLTPAEDPTNSIYVAAGSYLLGGLLILLRTIILPRCHMTPRGRCYALLPVDPLCHRSARQFTTRPFNRPHHPAVYRSGTR